MPVDFLTERQRHSYGGTPIGPHITFLASYQSVPDISFGYGCPTRYRPAVTILALMAPDDINVGLGPGSQGVSEIPRPGWV